MRKRMLSAPAGFGKTTLVSAWIADSGWPVAWLSLDSEDYDLTRFMMQVQLSQRVASDKGNIYDR